MYDNPINKIAINNKHFNIDKSIVEELDKALNKDSLTKQVENTILKQDRKLQEFGIDNIEYKVNKCRTSVTHVSGKTVFLFKFLNQTGHPLENIELSFSIPDDYNDKIEMSYSFYGEEKGRYFELPKNGSYLEIPLENGVKAEDILDHVIWELNNIAMNYSMYAFKVGVE